jgi:hypothetical protein
MYSTMLQAEYVAASIWNGGRADSNIFDCNVKVLMMAPLIVHPAAPLFKQGSDEWTVRTVVS